MADVTMPIAVIGMGFRGPGDADNVQNLWEMCSEARSAWCKVPESRFNAKAFYHPDAARKGAINVQSGHFMKGELGLFDAPFFGMMSAEADCLDPQQRLLLECCYEAMENGGVPLNKMIGSNTGVYVASFGQDWAQRSMWDTDSMPFYTATGGSSTMLSNRLSYAFDFKGPSMTVDTACSGSLVALHLACQSLRTGESDQVIVGGSSVLLNQDVMVSMTMMGFLSPDGQCYTFDHRANGYSRGEGAACILLKPLAAALKDGDHIRAVIRNSGCNQDGKTMGITLPNKDAQESLIRKVYQQAGLKFSDTTYVEAHGTGTQAGDPIEASAIGSVFSPGREVPLPVGSIKTNVGHLEAASGATAMIKVILMLEHKQILPNLNFEKANPNIPLEAWKIRVPTTLEPWESSSGILRASVNSFGFGGSNAHVIVEAADSYLATHESCKIGVATATIEGLGLNGTATHDLPNLDTNNILKVGANSPSRVFVLSSFSKISSVSQARNMLIYLNKKDESVTDQWLQNLAFTLYSRRSQFKWKIAVSASSVDDLKKAFFAREHDFTQALTSVPRLGFVFTGQGAQWHAMGRELFSVYPVYQKAIVEADCYLGKLGAEWSLVDELQKDAESSAVGTSRFSQPMCTAIQIALVQLLASWKIYPVSVTGHSSGEIAAGYAVGALSFESALLVAYQRGMPAHPVDDEPSVVRGLMMAVGTGSKVIEPFFGTLKSGRVVVACVNSPNSTTVSGDEAAILELRDILKVHGIPATVLRVDTAYHSHHMERFAEKYEARISQLKVQPSSAVSFHSSVTGKLLEHSELTVSYWIKNMVSPVLFSDSLQSLCLENRTTNSHSNRKSSAAVDVLIEIGPHSALAGPIRDILKSEVNLSAASIAYVPSLIRNQDAVKSMQNLACKLLEKGYEVDLTAVNAAISDKVPEVLVDLPPYCWDRSTSFWDEPRMVDAYQKRTHPRTDLLGVEIHNFNPLEPCWRNFLRLSEMPWLRDHRVHSNIVFPAAGYACMAIEAAYQRASEKKVTIQGYEIREFRISKALVIPDEEAEVEVTVSMRPQNSSTRNASDSWDEFSVFSVLRSTWTEHCRGLIRIVQPRDTSEVYGPAQLLEETARFEHSFQIDSSAEGVDLGNVYKNLAQLGIDYGPTFSIISEAKTWNGNCIGHLTVSDTAATMPSNFEYPFVIHPSTLDACLHNIFLAIASVDGNEVQQPAIPTYIHELFVSADIHNEAGWKFLCSADARRKDSTNIIGNVFVRNEHLLDQSLMISIKDVICHNIPQEAVQDSQRPVKDLAFNLHYQQDVDLLPQDFWMNYALEPRPVGEKSYLESMNKLALIYIRRAINAVNSFEITDMHKHHQKLYSSFIRSCELFSSFELEMEHDQQAFIDSVGNISTEARLICGMGERLPEILRKEIDPLSVMLEDDLLNHYYQTDSRLNCFYQMILPYLNLLTHKNPQMNILEIGAGTGGASLPILEFLGGGGQKTQCSYPRFQNYDYTDISTGLFEKAREKLSAWGTLVNFRKLDIEKKPVDQGFEEGSYDLIIAYNVFHATKVMANTLGNVRKLLKPGGRLIMLENTRTNLCTDLIWGTLPGWWVGEDDGRIDSPLLNEDQWDQLLKATGFSGLTAALWDIDSVEHHQASLMISVASQETSYPHEITLITDCKSENEIELVKLLVTAFEVLNITPVIESLSDLRDRDINGTTFIILSEIFRPLLHQLSQHQYESVQKIVLESNGMLWVTRGGTLDATSPNHALISGLLRTIRAETAGSALIHLDLDAKSPPMGVASQIMDVFKVSFNTANTNDVVEVEYSERNGSILVPRVLNNEDINIFIAKETQPAILEDQPFYSPDGRCLSVHVGSPGLLDSLYFTEVFPLRTKLEEGAVRIQVKACGINFMDVMMSMGQLDMGSLGIECSGIVVEVSPSVHHVQIGDRVAAAAYHESSTLGHFVDCSGPLVYKMPDSMSFEVGASLLVVYTTAYHSLVNVARIRSGETMLIHSAAGGFGQATITIAKRLGAIIYATVGTAEKKTFLMTQYQIPEQNIFTSRDNTFAQGVMRATNGRGVDVIINSVAGDLLRETFNCIAPLGRFLELGKRDVHINSRLEMQNFKRNVTFACVDLISLARDASHVVIDAWSQVSKMVSEGQIIPGPVTTFPMKDLSLALRTMQSGKHIGKLVIVPTPDDIVKVLPDRDNEIIFRKDASYLLVGGTGGLGRPTSEWMYRHGARNFIFASRSGTTKKAAKDLVEHLQFLGAKVAVFTCDISEDSQLKDLIAGAHEQNMPPIRGVVQLAMVLKDSLFGRTPYADWKSTLSAKVQGTWNLHNELSKTDLDFFIILSSLTGIVSNPGQGAYAASNTFQDAFASYRASLNLPVTTIDLGVIQEIGHVSQNADIEKQLLKQGFQGVTAHEYFALIKHAVLHPYKSNNQAQVINGLGTYNPERADVVFSYAMFSHYRRRGERAAAGMKIVGENSESMRSVLKKVTSIIDARALVCKEIVSKMATLLMIAADDISSKRSMPDYGMDSLVAVEMRNWIFKEMDATISILELLANTPLEELAEKVVQRSKMLSQLVAA